MLSELTDRGGSSEPQRLRREHKKSRNGCQRCKQRHVRCDEKKPLCTNCLIRGHTCQYTTAPASGVELCSINRIGSGSQEPFDSLAINLPFKSHFLIHNYVRFRDSFLKQFAATRSHTCFSFANIHPVRLKGVLMLTACNYLLLTNDFKTLGASYLHYKYELTKTLRESINDESTEVINDDALDVAYIMAMSEASRIGNNEAADAHFRGMLAILQARQKRENEKDQTGQMLLQNLLLTVCFNTMNRISSPRYIEPSNQAVSNNPFSTLESNDWAAANWLFVFMMWAFPHIPFEPGHRNQITDRFHRWLVEAISKNPQGRELSKASKVFGLGHKVEAVASAAYVMMLVINGPGPATIGGLSMAEIQKLGELRRWFAVQIKTWTEASKKIDVEWDVVNGLLYQLDWFRNNEDGIVERLLQAARERGFDKGGSY